MRALVNLTFVALLLASGSTQASESSSFDPHDSPADDVGRCAGDIADGSSSAQEIGSHRDTIGKTAEAVSCFSRCISTNPDWPQEPLPVIINVSDCQTELEEDINRLIEIDITFDILDFSDWGNTASG